MEESPESQELLNVTYLIVDAHLIGTSEDGTVVLRLQYRLPTGEIAWAPAAMLPTRYAREIAQGLLTCADQTDERTKAARAAKN